MADVTCTAEVRVERCVKLVVTPTMLVVPPFMTILCRQDTHVAIQHFLTVGVH